MNQSEIKSIAFSAEALEDQVNQLAVELGIDPVAWVRFMSFLGALKRHDLLTYLHSLRVGIYAQGLARYEHWSDPKFPFFGGCGHDYGKCAVPKQLLNAKRFTPRRYEQIKEHSVIGFEKLKDKFLFTAFIAGLHHKYQLGGGSHYGIDLEHDSPRPLDQKSIQLIQQTAQLVALADFFDSLVTRDNQKGLVQRFGDMEEAQAVMSKYFEPWRDRVEWLFEHRIV